MTDFPPRTAHNDNRRKDYFSDYIDRTRKEWRDLEEATADIWDMPAPEHTH